MYTYHWAERSEALPEDIPQLIVEVSATDPFVGLPSRPSGAELARLTARLSSGLPSGLMELMAVRDAAGTVVGCVAMTRASTANQKHIAELTTGAIHPDHRGRGIVRDAFAAIVERCESTGVELLRLDVREGIPAEKVWRQFGFSEYGRLPDYGRVAGESYAGVYLAQTVAHLKTHITSER